MQLLLPEAHINSLWMMVCQACVMGTAGDTLTSPLQLSYVFILYIQPEGTQLGLGTLRDDPVLFLGT